MLGDPQRRILGEVAVGEAAEQRGEHRVLLGLLEHGRGALLPPLHDLRALGAQQIRPAAQELQRAGVKLAQQRLLPARHRVGRHGGEIAEGEQVELVQVLLVAAERGEVGDHAHVVEVAPLRHLPHHQVLADQELDPPDVLLRDPQAAADGHRQAGADLAVRAAVGLADVVEQRAGGQRHRPGHRAHRLGRHRELIGVVATAERVQPPDRVERVLVDGVDVIDVVLHAARRRLPLRHQRGQQPEVLHLLEARRIGLVAPVADDLHEAAARVGIGAQRLAARGGQLAQHLQRPQRQRDVEGNRHLEDADHLRRLLLEHRAVFPLERPLAHDEALVDGAAVERRHRLAGAARLVAGGRPLQEPLGLVADQLGVRVVLVHQRLDRRVNRRADDAAADPARRGRARARSPPAARSAGDPSAARPRRAWRSGPATTTRWR